MCRLVCRNFASRKSAELCSCSSVRLADILRKTIPTSTLASSGKNLDTYGWQRQTCFKKNKTANWHGLSLYYSIATELASWNLWTNWNRHVFRIDRLSSTTGLLCKHLLRGRPSLGRYLHPNFLSALAVWLRDTKLCAVMCLWGKVSAIAPESKLMEPKKHICSLRCVSRDSTT